MAETGSVGGWKINRATNRISKSSSKVKWDSLHSLGINDLKERHESTASMSKWVWQLALYKPVRKFIFDIRLETWTNEYSLATEPAVKYFGVVRALCFAWGVERIINNKILKF